jgi:uncharacterized protein (TIGR03437 family)
MNRLRRWTVGAALLIVFAGPAQSQPPSIIQNGVFNAASRMPLSLPGAGVAPGEQIVIEGVRLSPGPVRVRLVHGSTQLEMAAELEPGTPAADVGRIKAVIPEQAPSGEGTIRVTRGEESSAPFPITIVDSNFGIFTRNHAGWGPGQIYGISAGQRIVNSTEAPSSPGDQLTLVGTGLGRAQYAGVVVAGVHSRSVSIKRQPDGREQITFDVPRDSPRGCYVPVWTDADGSISNVVTMSIRSGSGGCKQPTLLPPDVSEVTNTYAFAVLMRAQMHLDAGQDSIAFTDDEAAAAFLGHHSKAPILSHMQVLPPEGTCLSYTGTFVAPLGRSTTSLRDLLQERYSGLPLDAAGEIILKGPQGTRVLSHWARGHDWFGERIGGESPAPNLRPLPLFLEPGRYELISQGGADIGNFRTSIDIPKSVRWREHRAVPTITRSSGVTIDLDGSDPHQQVAILAMNVDQITTAMATSICMAPNGARRFTIPPEMLAHFPRTQAIPGLPMSLLLVISVPHPVQPIHARGLDLGYAFYVHVDGRSVVYR